MSRHKRLDFRQQRREEAAERQQDHDSLTLKQRYEKAVVRGHYRSREAVRLRAELKAA
jgi:hypothetical protein